MGVLNDCLKDFVSEGPNQRESTCRPVVANEVGESDHQLGAYSFPYPLHIDTGDFTDSSHASQPDPPTQQVVKIPITLDGQNGFDPDNNVCTQAISDVIEHMLNKSWRNYFEFWLEFRIDGGVYVARRTEWTDPKGPRLPGRRGFQQIMWDVRGGELQRLKWLSEGLRRMLLNRFANDPGLKKRSVVNKVNRASSTGGCLHTGGSATIPKTRARMTRSLDRPPTEPELFRETHKRKRDRSVVEQRTDDLLFSANLEQATQQAQEEGDESAATVDPNFVWRQTLSKPCKNRVYGAGGSFASPLRRSGYGGSSASPLALTEAPAAPEVVNLREQV
ncbi:hypothetical protein PIB30_022119 [Stylosanthes scabra]|uniref:Uncharacterized protein n=1 Tax=Stylosanthes scabra TaxID=79078 RepID=A0ABU6TA80_9FABA|nr:hypothetical protein [Stylosanthes scabra]